MESGVDLSFDWVGLGWDRLGWAVLGVVGSLMHFCIDTWKMYIILFTCMLKPVNT